MPGPAPKNIPTDELKISSEVTRDFPEFNAMALEVIAICSEMEVHSGHILATALKVDVSIGVAMYLSVKADSARESILWSALSRLLTSDDLNLFAAVRKVAKESFDIRHEFAHHLWARSSTIKNGIVLVDPRDVIENVAKTSDELRALIKDPKIEMLAAALVARPKHFRAKIFRRKQFENASRDAREAEIYLSGFHMMLWMDSFGFPKQGEKRRNWLRAQPRIQRVVQAQSGKPKS